MFNVFIAILPDINIHVDSWCIDYSVKINVKAKHDINEVINMVLGLWNSVHEIANLFCN